MEKNLVHQKYDTNVVVIIDLNKRCIHTGSKTFTLCQRKHLVHCRVARLNTYHHITYSISVTIGIYRILKNILIQQYTIAIQAEPGKLQFIATQRHTYFAPDLLF